ncbi:dTDP-4-dehydrorhamnose reductase [Roseofilum reptotaenium CS-1145]|uniref:dTDP-4-dehydrorhamnose reductase n=1 Tax=Roseofilum reptotaenium AO1-A TaxID=1925591 RepID=A0A1L9QRP4_9CYAN|nr:dTDP-4-dehydrorhamnose reductase [Roseofilum reptotaenium]MDB9515422.1 dTDP-4-dehydrorhamnose reductase [Roseofilum reptotaenium CS-1145]OJJ25302.1 dTDP-4-dehydrorhamnose reductase [Roseofilum reptotaenium AO1-A]
MTRILVTGAQGQLGQELVTLLKPLGEVRGIDRNELDLTEFDQVESFWQDLQPDIVVHGAAYTAVDKAEEDADLAMQVNGEVPGKLARLAAASGTQLIHISTDYVFDGGKNQPYWETDRTNPLSSYGRSKLRGEQVVQESGATFAILRTAWVYGNGMTGNFVKTMLRLGKEREELRVVYDQVGSPTWTVDLAGAIAQLIPKLNSETAGIYHYTNAGVTSWYDFAIAIFEEAQQLGIPLKIKQVLPITTDQYPTPAKRPAYSVLSGQKLSDLLGTPAPHWRQSLRKMLAEYAQKLVN